MIDAKGIRDYLSTVAPIRRAGPYFRRLNYEPLRPYIEAGTLDLLYSLGPSSTGGRFTPKGSAMKCLYVSEEELTAKAECYRLRNLSTRELEQAPASPAGLSYSITATMDKILDLTDAVHQNGLKISVAELTQEFRGAPDGVVIPTQVLGQLAYESGLFDGIRFFSAVRPGFANHVIWLERTANPVTVTET
jgi:hypothetical protein